MKGKVAMSRQDFTAEHKHLVKVLTTGTHKERQAEAKSQAKELARKK